jgi:hypothetical protein
MYMIQELEKLAYNACSSSIDSQHPVQRTVR